MRRVAVIGPNPSCGSLSGERFVEMLSRRLGLEAFSLRPVPGLVLAASADAQVSISASAFATPSARVEADTLIWLRFSPRAYLRDWLAGWLDVVLNGRAGARRRAYRAGLLDVLSACAALFRKDAVDVSQFHGLRSQLLFLELSSPEQAMFWVEMQEQRARETEPPRL